jgi:hypothetical protein
MSGVIADRGYCRHLARCRAAGALRPARLARARSGSFLGPLASDPLLPTTTAPIGEDVFCRLSTAMPLPKPSASPRGLLAPRLPEHGALTGPRLAGVFQSGRETALLEGGRRRRWRRAREPRP